LNHNGDTYHNGQPDLFSQAGQAAESQGSPPGSQTNDQGPDAGKKSGPHSRLYLTLWIIGLVGLIGVLLAVSQYWNRTLKVKAVSVQGNHFASEQVVKSTLQSAVGIKVDSLDFMHSLQQVENLPYVKRAHLNMGANGTLQVSVEERQPIGMCSSGSRKFYFDSEGILLPVVQGKSVNVPVVYGFNGVSAGDTLQGSNFNTIRSFMNTLQKNDLAYSTISEIAFVEDKGLVAITQGKRIRLVFGESNFTRKVNYWETFYDKVAVNNPLSSINEIDLRYEGQIITRS